MEIAQYLIWFSLVFLSTNFLDKQPLLVSAQCHNHQQSSLLQIKNTLVFDSTFSVCLSQWNQDTDCCTWNGVECDVNGHVIGLDLSFESISGGIEDSTGLFSLQHLKRLNLAFNQFNASAIPFSLGNLTNLTHLNLSYAGFAGQIPLGISRMIRLVVLDLSSYVFFSGSHLLNLENPNLKMLVQNLTELKQLHLDGVNISAQGREWSQALSASLPNLQILSLSNCFLLGPIHPSLAGLQSLSEIRLDGNNLSSSVPEFLAEFKSLTSLHLSYTGLYGTFPEKILLMPLLKSLELTENKLLQGALPEFLQNMSLQILHLGSTNFSGSLPFSLGNLKNLSVIELRNCNFTGPIPSSIAKLAHLMYLDLSNNNFTGPVPSLHLSKNLSFLDLSHNHFEGNISSIEWKGFENLVYLHLGDNSLGGNIPPSLFALPSLARLQLYNNQFEGQLPHCPNASSSALDTIDLSANRLEGSIPISIFNFKRLNTLVLSSNKFNGSIPLEATGTLQNLTTLDLSYNRLTVNANSREFLFLPQFRRLRLASCKLGVFPNLQNQPKLYHLDLSDNGISGVIPSWIWDLGEEVIFSSLNLSNNFLTSPQEPYKIPDLFFLDLRSNQLRGNIPLLPASVVYVDLSYNNFTSPLPAEFGNTIPEITYFSVSNSSITGVIPDSFCNATYLQVLNLSHNNLSGSVPNCLIERVETLGVLNLRGNNLNGVVSDTFSKNCGLQTLDLSDNRLKGRVPKSLTNCRTLEVLNLGNNQIDDVFPCWLKMVSSLRILVLRTNKFYGSITCSKINSSWPNLQIVDLAVNNFSGNLPTKSLSNWKAMMDHSDETQSNSKDLRFEFLTLSGFYYRDAMTIMSKGLEMELVKILIVFTSIDLSFNKFEGAIPEEIAKFKSLVSLNLSHNALTGPIPSGVGNMRQLESLDFSMNRLSGVIPSQLASLNFLSVLNLSHNHFTGRIPTGTQLQSFSPSSFEGNDGLCGPPLKNCSSTTQHIPSPKNKVGPKSSEFGWEFGLFVGIGFGTGFVAAVAPLIFSNKVDLWYDIFVHRLLHCFHK